MHRSVQYGMACECLDLQGRRSPCSRPCPSRSKVSKVAGCAGQKRCSALVVGPWRRPAVYLLSAALVCVGYPKPSDGLQELAQPHK